MNSHEAVNYSFMETNREHDYFLGWIQTVRAVQTKTDKQTNKGWSYGELKPCGELMSLNLHTLAS